MIKHEALTSYYLDFIPSQKAGNPGNFVSCSGANRRRMNVTSSIQRPGAMQCDIVDVVWEELFPDPHWNDYKVFDSPRTPPSDGTLHKPAPVDSPN